MGGEMGVWNGERKAGPSCVTNAINAKKDSPTNGDKEIEERPGMKKS